MRPTISKQSDMFAPPVDHELARELAEIDEVIHAHPEWVRLVHADLTKKLDVDGRTGRAGMPAAQVLRAGLLLRRLGMSLRAFAPRLEDSLSLREFLGLGPADGCPKRSTLQENIAKIRPETWGKLLLGLSRSAEAMEHETGDQVRIDATVTRTPIHQPSDSSLIWDCVRVLTRHMTSALQELGVDFEDHSRAAKKLHHRIFYARTQAQRAPAYAALLDAAERVKAQSEAVLAAIQKQKPRTWEAQQTKNALAPELERIGGLFARVISQTRRRVLQGETVPANEKVFSIFEEHTDIIVKNGNRSPEYGHKITLTVGKSSMVLDCVIERGNPGDVTLGTRQLERQKKLFGHAPGTAAFDGGYASKENLADAKKLGVARCAYSKGRGLSTEDMAGSRRTYGRLRDFRAGVEGVISFLKRSFGLDQCTWKGWERFKSYIWSGIFAANLTTLARARRCDA